MSNMLIQENGKLTEKQQKVLKRFFSIFLLEESVQRTIVEKLPTMSDQECDGLYRELDKAFDEQMYVFEKIAKENPSLMQEIKTLSDNYEKESFEIYKKQDQKEEAKELRLIEQQIDNI
jgi:translation initiation factor 2 alpha subunit (eIF-2alpha)